MSDRIRRSKEAGSAVLSDVIADAIEGLDAAVSDALLGVMAERAIYDSVLRPIARRAVEALDGADLVVVQWQSLRLLDSNPVGAGMWQRTGTPTLEACIRSVVECVVLETLKKHVDERAKEFQQ